MSDDEKSIENQDDKHKNQVEAEETGELDEATLEKVSGGAGNVKFVAF